MREAELLKKIGREVAVVSWIKDESSTLPSREMKNGLEVRRVKFEPPVKPLARAIGYRGIMKMFAEEIKAMRPDAILCHDLEMLWAAVMAGRSLGVPVLYHTHEDWPAMVSQRSRVEGFAFRLLERRLVKRVDYIYTAAERFAEKYRELGRPAIVQYGSKSLADIPHLTPDEKSSLRSKWGFGKNDFLVGIAGALGKGWAIPAIAEAVGTMPENVRLFFVGGFPDKIAEAMAVAEEKGVAERCVFTGPLKTPEYLRNVAILDVGLAVFEPWSDNLVYATPLKLFDYMGLGIPTVISDFPAMRKIAVDTCGFGVIAKPDDPASIRQAIEGLMRDPDRREDMSAAARRCFEETYCWERQMAALQASHPIFRN